MTKDGMKSAYELAMERLEKKDGKLKPLTGEQKKAIAGIESQTKAKIAQLEIMAQQDLAAARAKGDADKVREIEEYTRREIDRARAQGDEERERVRQGA